MPKDNYVVKKKIYCLDLSIPCHLVLAIRVTCVSSCAHLVLQRHMFHLPKDETFKYVFMNMMSIFKETIEYIDLTRAKSEASVYLPLIIKAKIILNLLT